MSSNGLIMKPIEGGIRVRQVGGHYLDVLRMAFGNRRLVCTPVTSPDTWDRGWCYRGPHALIRASLEAVNWPEDDPAHVPAGWYKETHTGRVDHDFFEDAMADLKEFTEGAAMITRRRK